jgi:ABC-type transporter Mla MlaB component
MEGELSFPRMRDWLAQADTLAAQAQLDLSRVTRIDSAGAAFLLELTRRARKKGHTLRLINAPAQVRGLLEFLQIDDVLALA